MNKFTIIALVACVASGALAAPAPEIHDEASQAVFESDEVEVEFNTGDAAIFNDFCFSSRDKVRAYMEDSPKSATARVFNMMDKLAQILATASTAGVLGTLTGKAELLSGFKSLKAELADDNLLDVADQACDHMLESLKPDLEKKFDAYKADVLKSPQGEQFADLFAKTPFNRLGCLTITRLNNVARICTEYRLTKPMLIEFF